MSLAARPCLRALFPLLLLLAVASPAVAQFQTPTVDGVVSGGEYAYSSGNWSMTWNETNLYIAHTTNEQFVVYLDVDPQLSAGGGTSANGNLTGVADGVAGSAGTITPTLPFRADSRILISSGGDSLKNRDGSGGWSDVAGSPIVSASSGSGREISIPWTALPGLTARASIFRFLFFEMKDDGSGNATMSDPMPALNPTGTAASPSLDYFLDINYSGNVFSYDWPGQRHRVFWVTTSADSGSGSLRAILTAANSDSSTRRHVMFNMSDGNTIQLASNLPSLYNGGIIIDGTTQPGFVSTPIVVIRGTGATDNATPSKVFDVTAVYHSFRGLVIQNAYYGFYSTDGFTALVDNCYIGTDVTGMSAEPNTYGFYITDWDNSVIENSVISGNLAYGVYTTGRAPWLRANIFGLGADGSTVIGGNNGVGIAGSGGTIGGANTGDGNVFGGLTGSAIVGNGPSLTVWANKIGVAANGVTARGNGGYGLDLTNCDAMVGDFYNDNRGNIIANNASGGVRIDRSGTNGTVVARNSMYANASFGISLTGTGVIQPNVTVSSATVDAGGNLVIKYSLPFNSATTQSPQAIALEVFDADPTNTSVPQGKTFRANKTFQQSADIVDDTWSVGSGFSVGDKLVVVASSYGNLAYTIPGDGTSAFTPVITTTFSPDKVFTGPGDFSDASKWNGGTLPTTGQSLQIIGSCTFDKTDALTYGGLFLGDSSNAGSVSFVTGNSHLLHVSGVTAFGANSAIDMTAGGVFWVDAAWNTANLTFTRGSGTVVFGGTSQTIPALEYTNVTVANSATPGSGTTIIHGALTVNGSLGAGYPVELRDSATIAGTGSSVSFSTLTIAAGATIAATKGFNINTQFTVNGTFSLFETESVSGSGTMSGSGTVSVTGPSLSSQYNLTRDLSSLAIEYTGTSQQTISATTYSRLRVANSAGAVLAGNVSAGDLTLDSGIVATSGNTFSATGPLTVGSGRINGSLTRTISASGAYSFPVGTSSASMPVSATFNGVTTGGTATFGATQGEHPQVASSGLQSTRDINGWWRYTPGTLVFSTMNLTLTFGSNVDGGATPAIFALRAYRNSAWSNVPATAASTSISASAVSAPAAQTDFAAGNVATDHYSVTASSPQNINTAFLVTVTAVDVFGATVSDATGSVTMTSNSNHVKFDANGDTHFNDETKSLVNGTFTILTKDNTAESMTVTATDTSNKSGTSSSIVILGTASAATSTISANPTSIVANGTSTSVITVQAKDSNGSNLVSGGATVTLATNRGTISGVTDNNNGTYTASLTSSTSAGTATITGTMNGTAMTSNASVTFTPGSATTLVVTAPSTAIAGSSFSVTVTARDANANTATGYSGTVHFTSSDGAASLPSNYTFVAGDNGVHSFTVTLNSTGSRSITATDTVTGTITGSALVSVATAFGAPQSFVASASSTTQVDLSWAPVSGATTYEIYRSSLNSGFSFLVSVGTTSHSDTTVVAGRTYLYEVRAVGASTSPFSAIDPATTILFTDPSVAGVNVRAVHLTELRAAIDAIRAAAGQSAASYTNAIVAGNTIQAVDFTEMRTALDAARAQIGLTTISYNDASITAGVTSVKAAHLLELRGGVQ